MALKRWVPWVTPLDGGACRLVVGGERVSGGDHHPGGAQHPHHLGSSGQLRCQGHHRHHTGLRPPLGIVHRRRTDGIFGVSPPCPGGKNGPLEMESDRDGAAITRGGAGNHDIDGLVGIGPGDDGGEVSGDPVDASHSPAAHIESGCELTSCPATPFT